MKTPNFTKTSLVLALSGLLLTGASVQAANPDEWGRWDPTGSGSNVPLHGGFAKVVNVGGQLVITDDSGSILGDHPGLVNGLDPSSPDDTAALDPGWTLYAIMLIEDEDKLFLDRRKTIAAVQGNLLLIPPEVEGDSGQVGLNYEKFTDTGLKVNGNIRKNGSTGQILYPIIFLAKGEEIFRDLGENVPFKARKNKSETLTLDIDHPDFDGGGGRVIGEQLKKGKDPIDFLTGGELRFKAKFDGEDLGGKLVGEGGFIAGQPTIGSDIAALQAGNIVDAVYKGYTAWTGYSVKAHVNFVEPSFTATFKGGYFDDFRVGGVIDGANFKSDPAEHGRMGGNVKSAIVNGTLFGPAAEAMAGQVQMEVRRQGEYFDIFAATTKVDGSRVKLPELPEISVNN